MAQCQCQCRSQCHWNWWGRYWISICAEIMANELGVGTASRLLADLIESRKCPRRAVESGHKWPQTWAPSSLPPAHPFQCRISATETTTKIPNNSISTQTWKRNPTKEFPNRRSMTTKLNANKLKDSNSGGSSSSTKKSTINSFIIQLHWHSRWTDTHSSFPSVICTISKWACGHTTQGK